MRRDTGIGACMAGSHLAVTSVVGGGGRLGAGPAANDGVCDWASA